MTETDVGNIARRHGITMKKYEKSLEDDTNVYLWQEQFPKVKFDRRLQRLHRQHRQMAKDYQVEAEDFSIGSVLQRTGELTWYVRSASREEMEHMVTRIRLEGCLQCQVKCRMCGVCPHIYLCSCEDDDTACKHVHLIHKVFSADMGLDLVEVEDIDDLVEVEQVDADEPKQNVFIDQRQHQQQLSIDEGQLQEDSTRPRLKWDLAESVDQMDSVPDSLLPLLKRKVSEMKGLLNLVEVPMSPDAVEIQQELMEEKEVLKFPQKRNSRSSFAEGDIVDPF